DEDTSGALSAHRRERRLDLGRGARVQDLNPYPEGPARVLRLSGGAGVGRLVRVLEDGHPGDLGSDRSEHLELLSHQLGADGGEPGEIAAGPSQAGDEALGHRIAGYGEDDRDRPGGLPGGFGS